MQKEKNKVIEEIIIFFIIKDIEVSTIKKYFLF